MGATTASTAPRTRHDYLTEPGLISWLFSLDHKRVAVLQLAGVGIAFALGLALALAMAWARATSGAPLLSRSQFGAALTLHALGMVFLVLLPGIASALGAFVMPLQLGARGVAFPRLHLASLYLWFLAFLCFAHAGLKGAPATGFAIASPLGFDSHGAVIPIVTALILLSVAALMRAIVFIVTIHQQRTSGLSWSKLPPLSLSLYAQSAVQLICAPVLVFALLAFLAGRQWSIGLFSASLGGDPTLFSHFFSFGAHGLIYSCALPAAGILSEVLTASSRRPLFAPRTFALALALFAALSILSYGAPTLTIASSPVSAALLSLPSMLLFVPACMLCLVWLGTLHRGTVRLTPALLFALGAMAAWFIAACCHLALAIPSLALHLGRTTFEIAQMHFLVAGGVLATAVAGIYLWWPKLSGRAIPDRLAYASAIAWNLGLHLAFLPLLLAGSRGLPQSMSRIPQEFSAVLQIATAGMVVLGVGFALVLVTLMTAKRRRHAAPANPMHLRGLEWCTASPPSVFNSPAD